jgi:hypothetical protein
LTDPKINVSLKLDGQKPWVTVYGDNAADLAVQLDMIAAHGIGPKAAAALASLQAGFETGAQLGAEQVASYPVAQPPAPAPQAAPAAPASPWVDSQSAPPAWAAQPAPAAPQQYQQPAPQQFQQPAPAAPAAPAGGVQGPFIPAFGMSATFRSGQSARGPWKAWFDPRPKGVTDALPKGPDGKTPSTDDPNHPGLAAGTHKFSQFIR